MCSRERERVRIVLKSSQALDTHSASDFKAVFYTKLVCDNEVATKDVLFSEKTFGMDIGGLNAKTKRSKTLPTHSQAIGTPQNLLFLHEKVEMSLDRPHVNGQFVATCISHETCHREFIPNDGTEKFL